MKKGLRVYDRWYSRDYHSPWGDGTVVEVFKTRIKVLFDTDPEPITYDASHIQFLELA